jgi:hypothetical protein
VFSNITLHETEGQTIPQNRVKSDGPVTDLRPRAPGWFIAADRKHVEFTSREAGSRRGLIQPWPARLAFTPSAQSSMTGLGIPVRSARPSIIPSRVSGAGLGFGGT